jgi:hypothetical protein
VKEYEILAGIQQGSKKGFQESNTIELSFRCTTVESEELEKLLAE